MTCKITYTNRQSCPYTRLCKPLAGSILPLALLIRLINWGNSHCRPFLTGWGHHVGEMTTQATSRMSDRQRPDSEPAPASAYFSTVCNLDSGEPAMLVLQVEIPNPLTVLLTGTDMKVWLPVNVALGPSGPGPRQWTIACMWFYMLVQADQKPC